MGDIPKFPGLTGEETLEDLIEIVGKMQKMINWWGAGRISSTNVQEIGGYFVNQTELKSRDGDVGMSSANDAADPVRLWAGSVDKDTAPWRVYKSGKGVATGWVLQSSEDSYPRLVFDPNGILVGVFTAEDKYITISPFVGSPVIQLRDGDNLAGISLLADILGITTVGKISIQADTYIRLNSNIVYVNTWSNLINAATSQTLQQALNNLQSQINSLDTRVTNLGG